MNPDSAVNRVTVMEHVMFVQICVYSYGGGNHNVHSQCAW